MVGCITPVPVPVITTVGPTDTVTLQRLCSSQIVLVTIVLNLQLVSPSGFKYSTKNLLGRLSLGGCVVTPSSVVGHSHSVIHTSVNASHPSTWVCHGGIVLAPSWVYGERGSDSRGEIGEGCRCNHGRDQEVSHCAASEGSGEEKYGIEIHFSCWELSIDV